MKAFATGLAFAFLASPALAATAQSLLEACDDDIACTEKWYELGETLFLYEEGAMAAVGPAAQACMRADIEAWQAAVDRTCEGKACVEAAYFDRISSLDPLQPGANTVASELPEAPGLVAVLGSEIGDAPAEAGEPLISTGNLVWATENPKHMGVALDAGEPAEHVIVFDIDIGNQPGHDTLLSLVESAPQARFTVRGIAEPDSDGVANFAPNACRFVYRLPD